MKNEPVGDFSAVVFLFVPTLTVSAPFVEIARRQQRQVTSVCEILAFERKAVLDCAQFRMRSFVPTVSTERKHGISLVHEHFAGIAEVLFGDGGEFLVENADDPLLISERRDRNVKSRYSISSLRIPVRILAHNA